MSYYITITECNLEYTNLGDYSLDPEDFHYDWYSKGVDVQPEGWQLKWSDGLITDLLKMIEQGIQGTLETQGEEGGYTRYVLTRNSVKEYAGHITYPNDPDIIHWKEPEKGDKDDD